MSTDTWIIEYRSPNIEQPVFFIWYMDTDENNTDKFLTFKTGEIFSASSLNDLKQNILSHLEELNQFENLQPWLDDATPLTPTVYDLATTYQSINAANFDIPTLESLTNFINLFGDYVHQDERNQHLQIFADNQYIRETWDYFYDFIFWPRFGDKEKFESWDRPLFVIDAGKLVKGVEELMIQFEDKMRIIK